jgi:hypothetical protein
VSQPSGTLLGVTNNWQYQVINVSGQLANRRLTVFNLHELLEERGRDGWELVSLGTGDSLGMTAIDQGHGQSIPVPAAIAVFKRPAPVEAA